MSHELWSDTRIRARLREIAWPYAGSYRAVYVDEAMPIIGQVRTDYAALLEECRQENVALTMRVARLQAQLDAVKPEPLPPLQATSEQARNAAEQLCDFVEWYATQRKEGDFWRRGWMDKIGIVRAWLGTRMEPEL